MTQRLNPNKEKLVVYENNDIVAWKAHSADDCIAIASDYKLPMSKIGNENLYSKYRLRFHSTFFFIRFKNYSDTVDVFDHFVNPLHFILIDAQRNNVFQWGFTDRVTFLMKYTTKETLVKKFPLLEILFQQNIIINNPLRDNETKSLTY